MPQFTHPPMEGCSRCFQGHALVLLGSCEDATVDVPASWHAKARVSLRFVARRGLAGL